MNLQKLQVLLLCLLMAGCGKDQYPGMRKSNLFSQEDYTQLTVAKGFKKSNALHKFSLSEEIDFEDVEIRDHVISGDKAYFLAQNHIAEFDLKTYRYKLVELPRGSWTNIAKIHGGIAVHAKGRKMLVWKPGHEIVEHNFDCLITNVFQYNKNIIIAFSNGLTRSYNPETKTNVWENISHNQYKQGLKQAALHKDTIAFVDAYGKLVTVDLDNGLTRDSIIVGANPRESKVATTADGICGMSNENLVVNVIGANKSEHKTIALEGIKSVQARGKYVILELADSYIVSTVNLLYKDEFISKIDKTTATNASFVYKKLIGFVDAGNVNIYEINTGDLVQKLPITGKFKYSIFDGKRIIVLAGGKLRIYS